MNKRPVEIMAYATLGSGSHDEKRLKVLLSKFNVRFVPFDRKNKIKSFCLVISEAKKNRPLIIVQEGTGVYGSLALFYCRLILGIPYVISSGDSVGPFLAQKYPLFSFVFYFYEKLLYRFCRGFIGWTPYLVGRAITLGARRGVTSEGFAYHLSGSSNSSSFIPNIRDYLKIKKADVVYGLVGSLKWISKYNYCYGMELVRAIKNVKNTNIHVIIAGDGDGLPYLIKESGDLVGKQIHFLGRINPETTIDFLRALNFGLIPQSCDAVGALRYTTKISEYIAAGLPIICNQIPMAYDLNIPSLTILPGENPWDCKFVNSISEMMDSGITKEITSKQIDSFLMTRLFDKDLQVKRITNFINDLV